MVLEVGVEIGEQDEDESRVKGVVDVRDVFGRKRCMAGMEEDKKQEMEKKEEGRRTFTCQST